MFCAHINGLYEQSCNDHSLNTARYASEALDCVGLTDTGYLAGLLHDVGKYSEEFDSYIHAANSGERVQKGSVIHSFAGARCVMERWHHKYNESISSRGWESITAEIIATAVGSHHGLFDEYDCEGNSGLDYRMNKQPEYDKKAVESFFSECISEEKLGELFEKAKQEIKGISGNCQSLAQSNEEIMFYIGLVQGYMKW